MYKYTEKKPDIDVFVKLNLKIIMTRFAEGEESTDWGEQ